MSSESVSGLFMPVLFLLTLALVLFSCVLHKRQQMEGSYQPSAEEHKQAKNHGVERPGLALPLPKEERLIWTMLKPHTSLGWSGRPKQNFHHNIILIFIWSPHTCAVLTNKWRVMDGEPLKWWWVFIWHFWERGENAFTSQCTANADKSIQECMKRFCYHTWGIRRPVKEPDGLHGQPNQFDFVYFICTLFTHLRVFMKESHGSFTSKTVYHCHTE